MITKTITIVNKLGLHARAAAKFVATASKFTSELNVSKKNQSVNGKSIMGVMMLAASQGTDLELSADGTDAQELIEAITTLVTNLFDEKE
jgi:phosphocarrier protein